MHAVEALGRGLGRWRLIVPSAGLRPQRTGGSGLLAGGAEWQSDVSWPQVCDDGTSNVRDASSLPTGRLGESIVAGVRDQHLHCRYQSGRRARTG